MRIKGSKIGTIVASTGVVIFTLAAAFSGSIAWFQVNRTQTVSSADFKVVNVGETVKGIKFYPYLGTITNSGTKYYSFSQTPTGEFIVNTNGELVEKKNDESDPDFQMKMNDFTLENPHQPILMLIEVSAHDEAYFSANIDSTQSVYPTTNNSLKGKNEGTNPLSSVVEFYTFTYSSNESDPTSLTSRTIDNRYVISTEECIQESDNWNSFVSFKSNGDYKGYGSEVVLYSGSTTEYKYIGIVVDYYSSSLEWISSYYLGDTRLEDKLNFECDWWLRL